MKGLKGNLIIVLFVQSTAPSSNTQVNGSIPFYIYTENQSDQSYEQLPVNSTTDNAVDEEDDDGNEEFNDLSDLFSSSQGDILDCELSEIQDVNDLVSSIKSSPLRSLMLSPQKTMQMTDDDKLSHFFIESPNKCKGIQQSMENNEYTDATSGYMSADMTNVQQEEMISFLSPAKINHESILSKKCSVFSPSQVRIGIYLILQLTVSICSCSIPQAQKLFEIYLLTHPVRLSFTNQQKTKRYLILSYLIY